jgi:hypothetical protein
LPFISCVAFAPRERRQYSEPPKPAARHWVHDAQLRQIMQQLERQHLTIWPQELDKDSLNLRSRGVASAFDQAASFAGALAETALDIPHVVTGLSLSEADRSAFLAQADALRREALQLQDAAQREEIDRMRQVLHSIDATCDLCHRQFREFAGPR